MSKKPAKRWWPCFIRIYVEFQKRALPPSHFLAGPTFVPLWVSHKLKTNPILFFPFFSFFQKGKATEKPILHRFLRYVLRSCVENSAFSRQKKKTAFLRSFGLRFSPTFSPMAIPFWDGHAWEGFSAPPNFCLPISIPLWGKQAPKWQFSRHFFCCGEAVFSISQRVESKPCWHCAIDLLQAGFPRCKRVVKE